MKKGFVAAAIVAALSPAGAFATDGYFSHGYGMKAKGRAGASTAMTTDTFGGANNPATMVWIGDRLDVGLDWFSPQRNAERTGSLAGLDAAADSDSGNFLIPEFGYNKMLNPGMSLGVTVYGNGGMNTNYPGGQIAAGSPVCGQFNPGATGPYNMLCGTGRLGVDLMQLIVAPTFAMKAGSRHSFGISPLLGYQRFKAQGLQGFQGFTPNPATFATDNHLTNNGYDNSTGFGVRVGWLGRLSDSVSAGAAYATRMKMSKFDKYKDLFAEEGGFDLPSNWNAGLALAATSRLTLALDYQRINYSEVKSVGNPSTNTGNAVAGTGFTVGSLGCADCRGFGWQDVNVVKLGVEYQYSQALTLRAGYNHSDNPIQARDVTFNILAPGVVQDHVTAGFTYAVGKSSEVTLAYMHAFQHSVSGPSLYNSFGVPAGNEKIQMYENSLGIAWGTRF
jgi:long-chain fatty acid transport protein